MRKPPVPLLTIYELKRVRRFHWFDEALSEPENCFALHLNPRNPTEHLEENLRRLYNLQSLVFDATPGLKEPPQALEQLVNLQELSFYHAGDFSSLGKTLPSLKHLKKLVLHSCKGFEEMPPEICEIKSLEKLVCDRGSIRSLPDTLHLLPHLKELQLFDNRSRSIPSSLFQAPMLEILAISQRYALKIPGEIVNMKKLREFYHGVLEIEGMSLDELKAAFPKVTFVQPYHKAEPYPED